MGKHHDPFLTWCLHGKLQTLYPLFHKTNGHQSFKDLGLGWVAPAYQVIVTFDYKNKYQMNNWNKDPDFYIIRL